MHFCKRAKDLDLTTLKLDRDLIEIVESLGTENTIMFARAGSLKEKIRSKLEAAKRAECIEFDTTVRRRVFRQSLEWEEQLKTTLKNQGYFRDHSDFSNVGNFAFLVCNDGTFNFRRLSTMIEVLRFNHDKEYDSIRELTKPFFEKHCRFLKDNEILLYTVPHYLHGYTIGNKRLTKRFNSFYESFDKSKADEIISSTLSECLTPLQKDLFLFVLNREDFVSLSGSIYLSETETDIFRNAVYNFVVHPPYGFNDYRNVLDDLVSY